MYCRQCGKQIEDGAAFCPYCGADQAPQAGPQPPNGGYGSVPPVEESGVGWGVLGFFIPIVGLILFLVWRDEHPARSKGAGIGALIGVCLSVVTGILWGIIFSAMLSTISAAADVGFAAAALLP